MTTTKRKPTTATPVPIESDVTNEPGELLENLAHLIDELYGSAAYTVETNGTSVGVYEPCGQCDADVLVTTIAAPRTAAEAIEAVRHLIACWCGDWTCSDHETANCTAWGRRGKCRGGKG